MPSIDCSAGESTSTSTKKTLITYIKTLSAKKHSALLSSRLIAQGVNANG
jgi:hypothetical protein